MSNQKSPGSNRRNIVSLQQRGRQSETNSQSNVSLISNRQSPISQFDLVTLLEVSHQMTTRQKQLLIAIQQSDAQYLIDMDIMEVENAASYDFRFSEFNITPVMLACAIGSTNIVKIIMQSPMRDTINHADSQGFNCLYYAVYHGHQEVINILKKLSVVYKKDDKNTSCLHIAIMRGHLDIVELLLRKTPRSAVDDLQNSPNAGQTTALSGKEDERKKLLIKQTNQAIIWEQQIEVDEQRIDNGISTIFFAIRAGNLSCLKLLRKYGANFNLDCMSESKQMMRPIQYAVYRGNMALYELIVECNSDQGESQFQCQMSATGSSLLHLCAFKGNVIMLKHLLAANLNPFAQNKQGDTCLHVAIRRNHSNFMYELISWCVAKNITAAQAEVENVAECLTPFMTAVLRDQFEIANLLVKNNLATRGYVNREGRDVRIIAEDADKVRALAYLDNREIPQIVKHSRVNGSMETLLQKKNTSPVKLTASKFQGRKASVDSIVATRKDDIFGKSYDKEMQTSTSRPTVQNDHLKEEAKGMTQASSLQTIQKPPRDLPPFNKSRDFDRASGVSQQKIDILGKNEERLSQASSHHSRISATSLTSPLRGHIRAPKMPMLDIDQVNGNDDIDKVHVKDFIKNSRRR